MSVIGNGLVILGTCVLMLALIPARGVIGQLSQGSVQRRWKILTGLILVSIAGYIDYAAVSWNSHSNFADLLVPAIFVFGALFVLIVNSLSLQASIDVKRISTLERESVTDHLMGIHNRRYFDRRLDEEFARARRYGPELSVLLLDIDHFKRINDAFGHRVGDIVLESLGRLIVSVARRSDIVARYGGEEIVVIAPNTSSTNAVVFAERLRQVIETSVMAPADVRDGRQDISVTVSIGVATVSRESADGNDLMQRADKALYQAKQEGRNRVVVGNGLNNGHCP